MFLWFNVDYWSVIDGKLYIDTSVRWVFASFTHSLVVKAEGHGGLSQQDNSCVEEIYLYKVLKEFPLLSFGLEDGVIRSKTKGQWPHKKQF